MKKQTLTLATAALLATANLSFADPSLETETARLVKPGKFEFGTAFEYQWSKDGKELALPMSFATGLSDSVELLIEPIFYTSIRPKGAASSTGLGDLETAITWRFFDETDCIPALAIAGEVKFPTARNENIGSGKFDERIYLVASKRIGDVDFHVNIGYTNVGAPAGVDTKNPFDAAFAVEWFVNKHFDIFGEVLYAGASVSSGTAGDGADGSSTITSSLADGAASAPELGVKNEIVGTLGVRVHLTEQLDVFTSFNYDNQHAKLVRVGFTLKF